MPTQQQAQEVRDLFATLQSPGAYAPRLSDVIGAYHFVIDAVGRWDVRVDHGHLTSDVAHAGDPECTLEADASNFLAIMKGEENAITAMMRGDVFVDGDPILMTKFAMTAAAQRTTRH